MFRGRSGGSSRGRARGVRAGATAPRGLYSSGVWHCGCNPRLPANHFKVKKEGPNEGRWFYCCQKDKPVGCGFWIWDSEAEPRMQAAVLNNTTTELGSSAPPSSSASTTESEPSQSTKVTAPPPLLVPTIKAPSKRKLPWSDIEADDTKNDDEEPFPWSPTQAEVKTLSNAVDQAASRTPAPETPRKAQKTSLFTTPHQAVTTYVNGLPTPNTSSRKLDYLSVTPFANVTPQTTPTPTRFRDALETTPGSGSNSTGDLSGEVFTYLATAAAHFTPEQASGLRVILEKHTLKTQGITKGRDVLRAGIQTREGTIAKLRQRAAALESELESQKAVTLHLRQMLQENKKAMDELVVRMS